MKIIRDRDKSQDNIIKLVSKNTEVIIKKPQKKDIKPKKEEKETPEAKAFREELEWREREVANVFKKSRAKMGRPTKLNKEIREAAMILARIGLTQRAIAESLCTSEQVFIGWRKKNKEFDKAINEAREKGKSVLINSIYGHGRKSWQATAWLLERQYRNEFALDKQKLEVTGKDSGPIVFRVVFSEKAESK